MPVEILDNARVDFFARQRVVEQRGSDTDGRRAGDHELDCIGGRDDAALANDGHVVLPGYFVDLVHFQQCNGLDCGTRQAAANVANDRGSLFGVDRHAHDRVDHGEAVGARLDAQACIFLDVRLVRRQLGNDRLARVRTTGGDDPCRHLGVVAELHAAFLDVRAGDVDFDGVNRRIVEALRDALVFLDRGAGDIRKKPRLGEIETRENVIDHPVDPGILQADCVEHAHRRFIDTMRLVAETRVAGRALENNGADVGVRETLDARVFLAEPDAARQQHDRRRHRDATELGRERAVRFCGGR